MKKILNSADSFVDESLEGIIAAHADCLKFSEADRRR
jgi:dihydroxyacetone kinase